MMYLLLDSTYLGIQIEYYFFKSSRFSEQVRVKLDVICCLILARPVVFAIFVKLPLAKDQTEPSTGTYPLLKVI